MITESGENWVQNKKEEKRNSFIYLSSHPNTCWIRLMERETWKWVLGSGHRGMVIKETIKPLERYDQCYVSFLLSHRWYISGKHTEDSEIR